MLSAIASTQTAPRPRRTRAVRMMFDVKTEQKGSLIIGQTETDQVQGKVGFGVQISECRRDYVVVVGTSV